MFRFEYFAGHAHIRVFSLPHIPEAIRNSIDFDDWRKQLPGLDPLHVGASRGLEKIVLVSSIPINFKTASHSDSDEEIWPESGIFSGFGRGMPRPKVVFEVSYPQDHEYAAAKAKHFLLKVREPRPSAFIILKLHAQHPNIDVRNTSVSFEVWRRHENDAGQLQKAERGQLWPRSEAIKETNPQYIKVSLEELVGNLEVVDAAIRRLNEPDPDEADHGLKLWRDHYSRLRPGLLQEIRHQVANHATTKLPISILTDAVGEGLAAKWGEEYESGSE